MTYGYMRDANMAIAEVSVRGSGGAILTVDAVIDTGFTQYLTLPPVTISALDLVRKGELRIRLADGTRRIANVYEALVKIHNDWILVTIEESDGDILIGMGLLYGSQLSIDVIEDGVVSIDVLD